MRFDTSSNTFAKLHDFGSITDGVSQLGGVTVADSIVFGTALGGTDFAGTLWSFDSSTDGTFKKLHDFRDIDGRSPEGGVTLSGATLYGTANAGSANEGTIWSDVTGADVFTTLHEFRDGDGIQPTGTVAFSGTTLYGTASRFRLFLARSTYDLWTSTITG